ncbi:hypothetical protein ACFX2U_06625 [Gilliamella apicola]|uniref:hypothetical protein n=1 Tax=Gilliamella apicola TaxID=1196095 RepID=UPI00351AEA5C
MDSKLASLRSAKLRFAPFRSARFKLAYLRSALTPFLPPEQSQILCCSNISFILQKFIKSTMF